MKRRAVIAGGEAAGLVEIFVVLDFCTGAGLPLAIDKDEMPELGQLEQTFDMLGKVSHANIARNEDNFAFWPSLAMLRARWP